ncbi:MAG: GTP-binding protein, partial [Myxococcota bacterium]
AGVQAQTRTVQRQMARYGVPCVAFVNKCDLPGADPARVVEAMSAELGLPAVLMQWPLGLESEHHGSIDLLTQEAITFAGPANGLVVRAPVVLDGAALAAREVLLEAAAEHDDALFTALVEGRPPDVASVERALARATHARKLVPVFVGSARQNLGVQPLLDGVVAYLPGPDERPIDAVDPETGAAVEVEADPEGPVLAYAFKLQETDFGPLTWLRVYRGVLRSGASLVDVRTGRKQRIRRLFRLDAGTTVPRAEAGPGEVVAVSGLDVASGTSLADPAVRLSIGSMHVPEPVVRRALVLDHGDEERLGRGLSKLVREDPTLRVVTDPETGETVLCGMGELHLEVVATRLHQRFGVEVRLGEPTVAARQALTQAARFDHLFKRQKGGPGLWARIVGTVEPAEAFELDWAVVGGAIPTTYWSAVERGLRQALAEAEPEVVGARVVITDGATHSTDSSDVAFELAARMAFREVLADTAPVRLEPWVHVVAEAPEAMHGALVQSLTSRRGRIRDAA